MRLPRIFSSIAINKQAPLVLKDQAYQHVAKVLRCQVGQSIMVFDGLGGEYQAIIMDMSKAQIVLQIGQYHSKTLESPLAMHVGVGLLPPKQLDWIIQKSVELGVTELTPLYLERSKITSISQSMIEKKMQHWQGIITHACEQCGRNQLPTCHTPKSLTQWLEAINPEARLLYATPHAPQPLTELTGKIQAVQIVIGPEGGLSEAECQQLKAHRFQAVGLGPRILRAETAVVVAVSVLQSLAGDYQVKKLQ